MFTCVPAVLALILVVLICGTGIDSNCTSMVTDTTCTGTDSIYMVLTVINLVLAVMVPVLKVLISVIRDFCNKSYDF